MNNPQIFHFFLGGHDAEMMEIKNILSDHGYPFEDADLQWDNAKVSVYGDKLAALPADKIPVLIELVMDTAVPDRSCIIDHHGEHAGIGKKTSLEKIAELLQIQLTRDQQLISANDLGHIRWMLGIGATPEEIEKIRLLDRNAQKITDQDDLFADEAISQIQEPFPGVALIESKTKRTAAIIDKIWNRYQTFIIKCPGEIHVSGTGKLIQALKDHYKKIEDAKPELCFWSGGMLPSYGYFGSNYYDEKEVLDMAHQNAAFSQHVFLFPFMIEHWKNNRKVNLDLSAVYDTLTPQMWECARFSPFDNPQHYNEYSYFHDYTRTALFGKLKCDENGPLNKSDLFSKQTPKFVSCLFSRRTQKGVLEMRIKHKEENIEKTAIYNLAVDSISLRLFETGIAILAIELLNYKHSEFNDILRINDYGRRVYPQFLGSETGGEIEAVKYAFLADSITMTLNSPVEPENFHLGDFFIKGHDHLHLGKHITSLLGDDFVNKFRIEPIIDDRMFTLCWYGNDALIDKLIHKDEKENQKVETENHQQEAAEEHRLTIHEQPFESSQEWYRFVFLDGNVCMCQDKKMLRSHIESTTYRRWVQWSTLYGLSRYSMVCLTGITAPDFIKTHMRRQYRLMAEILLAQRASIITFFRRVADISNSIDGLDEDNGGVSQERQKRESITKDIRKLNRDFLGFKNRLWFIEITPQEQGIEMYDMAMKNMGLEKQIEELKDEIKELYEYAEMQNDRFSAEENTKLNKQMLILTILAAVAIPISLIFAGWGMSKDFVEKKSWKEIFTVLNNCLSSPFVDTIIIALIMTITIIIGVIVYGNKGGNK
ncbi:MAG: CorA family divalent cation transporter [Deltaproteobacteria bacterium]|nr:CorA family divalent cation transporter [Deltaproteobacteria bacterium]